MVKKTKKALINHHLSEKQLLEKKIESKKYLLKIKDNFSILKQPKIFEGEYDSNTYENISNDKFIELSNMNNKGIIQLNELKKELKDSLIGKTIKIKGYCRNSYSDKFFYTRVMNLKI